MKWCGAGILAALTVVACDDATGVPVQDLDVVATAVDATTLAMWVGPTAVTMCEAPDCPEVAPHEAVPVGWDDVLGWVGTTTQISVYWWQVVSDGEGRWRVSDETIRSTKVNIP